MDALSSVRVRAFFDHIPKTGGTACYEHFRRCLGDDLVSPFVLFELAPDALAKHAERTLISGHLEPLPGCLPADRIALTVLRDPIERVLSEYSALRFDELAEPGDAFEAIRRAKRAPLIELLLDEDPKIAVIFRNRQTRHFAGYTAAVSLTTTEAQLSQWAKEALSRFDLLGVYDDLEGFMELACESLGIPIPDSLPPTNVTSRKISFDSLDSREQELLVSLNRADIDLVKYARNSYRAARRETLRRLIDSGPSNAGKPTNHSEPRNRAEAFRKQAAAGSIEFGTYEIKILEVQIKGIISNCNDVLSGENTTIRVLFHANIDESDLTVGLRISDSSGTLLHGTNTYHQGLRLEVCRETDQFVEFSFRMALGLGAYTVGVTIHTGDAHTSRCFHWKENAARFTVVGNIEEHFEGVANLSMSVSGGSVNSHTPLRLARRPTNPSHCRSLVVHSPRVANPSAILAAPQEPVSAQPEEAFCIEVTVKNTGHEVWPPAGTRPVCCAYHIFDSEGECVIYDGIRTRLREVIRPDEGVGLQLAVVAPARAGTYQVEVDLVQESVSWFGASGANRFTLIVGQSDDGSGR